MKYIRLMIFFSLILVLIGFLLVIIESGKKPLSIEATAESKPESVQETRFFRVYLNETETDNKTIMPMNEYESKDEKGYVIVGIMDGDDYERLLNTGFEIEEVSNPLAQVKQVETSGKQVNKWNK
ncbi:MAG: hypothetical protein ACMUIU_19020 [bacterium]